MNNFASSEAVNKLLIEASTLVEQHTAEINKQEGMGSAERKCIIFQRRRLTKIVAELKMLHNNLLYQNI